MADQDAKTMTTLILGIVVIAVTLVIGIYIQASLQTTLDTPNVAVAVVNESALKPTTAGIILAGFYTRDGACGTITAISNGTGGTSIALGNITQNGCTYYNASSVAQFGATWLVSYPYTYSADNNASAAAGSSVDALANGTPWLTIIVVVGFAVIVLGMLTSGLGKRASLNQAVY